MKINSYRTSSTNKERANLFKRNCNWIYIVFFLNVLFLSLPVKASMLPWFRIQRLCFDVNLIVAGRHIGNGKVEIEQVFFAEPNTVKLKDVIEVPCIPELDKIPGEPFLRDANTLPILTNRLVMFLKKNEKENLEPIYGSGKGSAGVFWYDDKDCYGYEQMSNPGPYVLVQSVGNRWRIPKDKQDLWQQIVDGLELRKGWEEIKSIQDPYKRAEKMCMYLLPQTAPKIFDRESINLRTAIVPIGQPAVPSLINVLKIADPCERLDTTFLILYDIGFINYEAIRPAVPLLCKFLQNPGVNSQYYILSALTSAADPRAIPYVRPMLNSNDSQVESQAALALSRMHDIESYDEIAKFFKVTERDSKGNPVLSEGQRRYPREFSQALYLLNPDKATPIIKQAEEDLSTSGLYEGAKAYYNLFK